MKNTMVSIVCNTYNHEKYIQDALDGFISQKTKYSYEILIMDDASTDSTASIIKQYEIKYPNVIFPIYNEENLYSKDGRPGPLNRKRARGKYVALCEGDDYWIDEYKLEKQIDYMENHPDCSFVFSNGLVKYGETVSRCIIPWDKSCLDRKLKGDLNAGEIERFGYIPTASFVYRNGVMFPEMPKGAFLGDAYIKISSTLGGYAHYFDEKMVVYRRGVDGSTTAVWNRDVKQYVKLCDSFIKMFQGFNQITNNRYSDVFDLRITQWRIEKYSTIGDAKQLRKINRTKEYYAMKNANMAFRIVYFAKLHWFKQYSFIRRILKSRIKRLNK